MTVLKSGKSKTKLIAISLKLLQSFLKLIKETTQYSLYDKGHWLDQTINYQCSWLSFRAYKNLCQVVLSKRIEQNTLYLDTNIRPYVMDINRITDQFSNTNTTTTWYRQQFTLLHYCLGSFNPSNKSIKSTFHSKYILHTTISYIYL